MSSETPTELPAPSSSGEEDEMPIRLKSIPTLSQLYKSSVLCAEAAAAPKYTHKAAYLDRVSLLCVTTLTRYSSELLRSTSAKEILRI